jgi:hypothetical protein
MWPDTLFAQHLVPVHCHGEKPKHLTKALVFSSYMMHNLDIRELPNSIRLICSQPSPQEHTLNAVFRKMEDCVTSSSFVIH